MGVRINTNIDALNAQRNLLMTGLQLSKSIEKLSSGLRINRAGDDAAGLAVSEKLRAQVRGLNQAMRNAQDGISLIQTAEGALNETHSILQRMRELAVQAANDATLSADDKAAIDKEMDELVAEIDKIAERTEFNGTKLLNGTFTNKTLQVGANASQTLSVTISSAAASALGTASSSLNNVDVTTDPTAAITIIDAAIVDVNNIRADLGAKQNRLEHTIANLGVAAENLAASESRIRDVDMAAEMVAFTRSQILQQAGTAILAQANQTPQSVLALLR
jgi:flagellin